MPRPPQLAPRRLAWTLLAGLGLLLALITPVSRTPGRPVGDPLPDLRLLADDSPWLDRARLADPAAVVLPPVPVASGGSEAIPDAVPFPPVPPDLRSASDGGLRLSLSRPSEPGEEATAATLPELPRPLTTLGERVARGLPTPRPAQLRAVGSDSGAIFEKSLDDELHKLLSNIDLRKNNPPVFSLGIDAFGLQSLPVLLEGTGNRDVDQGLLRWAARQPWPSWLPPGSYRIEIAP